MTSYEKMFGVFIVSPVGSIDITTYPILEKKVDRLLQTSPATLVFDMKEVEYVSSAGVRVVLKAQKALKKREGKLVLMNLQPHVKKVFEIINALPSQQIFSSIEELDRYLGRIQRTETE
ncbi:MAG: STAS domain-containing protein [bacterium]|nr:STAS domain-containing protein [bacterium]